MLTQSSVNNLMLVIKNWQQSAYAVMKTKEKYRFLFRKFW
jgi:hypothetical protein